MDAVMIIAFIIIAIINLLQRRLIKDLQRQLKDKERP